jgi:hypothetical protein
VNRRTVAALGVLTVLVLPACGAAVSPAPTSTEPAGRLDPAVQSDLDAMLKDLDGMDRDLADVDDALATDDSAPGA